MKGSLLYRKQSLRKCEKISNFGIIHGKRARLESKEDCENASYWGAKYPNENVFVSYDQSGCFYDLDRHVALVSKPNATVTIFSPCDQIDIDSTVIGKNNTVEPGKGAQFQEEGNYKRILIICISSGGVGVLILIVVVHGVVRKTKKNINIMDENAIYGRNEPNVYYEDGKNTQIEDKNEYYG